jgi:peptidoglycan/LPS O-acetylase OafA/YrhL
MSGIEHVNSPHLRIADNNFDLIRLGAAVQVALLHVTHSLSVGYSTAPWARLLEVFPGVPIFFFISGLLISRSYERSKSLKDYALNRTLRIFPGLHVCVLLNIIAVAATGYFGTVRAGLPEVAALYLAKTTIVQFYNPAFMRGFGDGVLNGSLWTICVELQFYVLIPLIYRLFVSSHKTRSDLTLAVLLLVSMICNRVLYHWPSDDFTSVWWKLARVSFLPWVYMFLAGVLVQRNFDRLCRLFKPVAFWLALPLYALYALGMEQLHFGMDNSFSPLLFFPLVFLVCCAAYYPSRAARGLLHGNDISYGIYIYHVPVMNMFLFYGLVGSMGYTFATVAIAIVLAIASWLFIERPSLSHKRRPARPMVVTAG